MQDGRRDPLEADRSNTRRLHIEVGGHTAWLYGGRVAWLLDSAGVPRQRDLGMPGVCTCPASRVDDVVTFAEHLEGRYVTVERIEP